MPALVGTCWADDVWSADAWAADTWGGVAVVEAPPPGPFVVGSGGGFGGGGHAPVLQPPKPKKRKRIQHAFAIAGGCEAETATGRVTARGSAGAGTAGAESMAEIAFTSGFGAKNLSDSELLTLLLEVGA